MNTEANENSPKTEIPAGYVGHTKLLELIFPDEACRPSTKWLQRQRDKRLIPFVKMGRMIFYDPPRVRSVIAKRFEVATVGGK